jgi:hypothetical protein
MREPINRSKERGSNIVEMAILMTVLLLLVLGVIDLGRAIFIKVEVANAIRAGALYGAQGPTTAADTAGITTAIRNEAPDIGASITNISIGPAYCQCVGGGNVTCGGGGCGAAPQIEWLQVTGQFNYTPWLNVPYFGFRSLAIKGVATVPVAGV